MLRSVTLTYLSPPNLLTNLRTSKVSLNYQTTRRFIFLLFLTTFLTAATLFKSLNLVYRLGLGEKFLASINAKRVNFFLGSGQKAPMAHRQYSQNQYGIFYYKITTSFRLVKFSPNYLIGQPLPALSLSRLFFSASLPQSSAISLKFGSFRLSSTSFLL